MGLTLLAFSAQTAHAQTARIEPPTVPDILKPATGEQPILKIWAKGVQIYTCGTNPTDATKFEWVFKAPEADLFDAQGVKMGKHYAGPSWEANDGSKVVGEVKQRVESPGGMSIPWLLLSAKENSGTGLLSKVSSVQRVDTVGGLTPAPADCTQAKKDSEVRVGYSAVYYFYNPASASLPTAPASGFGGNSSEGSFTSFTILLVLGLILTVSLTGLLVRTVSFRKK
jgi:Protein of unknown function (DUF3455)